MSDNVFRSLIVCGLSLWFLFFVVITVIVGHFVVKYW